MCGVGTNARVDDVHMHRAVWNVTVRTLAKLMVCEVGACAVAIETGALKLLAKAAVPGGEMDIRLRAAAGLAAIAAWSGPRRAVEIVDTEGVVVAMAAVLNDTDDRIPGHLRSAVIDGLVVMSFRRRARKVLQMHGCDGKIAAAARRASMSGDYHAAARSTVAAGQLAGRSVDEFGFLVEEELSSTEEGFDDGLAENGSNNREDSLRSMRKRPTGLRHIQQQLLEEPYMAVEDLVLLEEIVHEDAGLLGSSP